MSKKVILSADESSASVADATVGDIVTTLFSSNECLTGAYKYVQTGLVAAGTAAVMNKRHTGSYTNFGG